MSFAMRSRMLLWRFRPGWVESAWMGSVTVGAIPRGRPAYTSKTTSFPAPSYEYALMGRMDGMLVVVVWRVVLAQVFIVWLVGRPQGFAPAGYRLWDRLGLGIVRRNGWSWR